MGNIMIDVRNLSKSYRLGSSNTGRISTDIQQSIRKWVSRDNEWRRDIDKKESSEIIWSLNNISFQVEKGDVLGIIGKNGAGKSTLLKIISKITKPTKGEIRLKGSIGSLLEVGTGFHPDLTGRENIFLNGAILGMKKAEIVRKFDEIVEFSGVERFLETPVKRYSSGMFVRLGFAVAAHLDPEILIVDEVLAVGDYEFQQKCLGKMRNVAAEGRTILFVSHSAAAIGQLCNKAILLKEGELISQGTAKQVLADYQSQVADSSSGLRGGIFNNGLAFFTGWKLVGDCLPSAHSCYSGDTLDFVIDLTTVRSIEYCEIRMMIRYESLIILHTTSLDQGDGLFNLEPGKHRASFIIDFPIRDAQFDVEFTLVSAGTVVDIWLSSTKLTVLDSFKSRINPGMLNIQSEFILQTLIHSSTLEDEIQK